MASEEESGEGDEGKSGVGGGEVVKDCGEAGGEGGGCGVRVGVVEEVKGEASVQVAAEDGYEAVEGLLGARGREVERAGMARVCVAQVLKSGAVTGVVVPDGEFEEGSAEEEEELRFVGFFEGGLERD